jgi:NAD(P)H-hydrate epimerase
LAAGSATRVDQTMSERIELHGFPVVTAEEMHRLVRAAVEEYGISLEEMTELVAARLASLTGEILGMPDRSEPLRHILLVIGLEECGVIGLATARHLANRGLDPHLVLACAPAELTDLGRRRLGTVEKMGLPVVRMDPAVGRIDLEGETQPALLIDALAGYCGSGQVTESAGEIIRWMNGAGAPIVSLEVPSGLDATTGERAARCIKAHTTMTLGLPKQGLLTPAARRVVGRLILTDMGLPYRLYRDFGLEVTGKFPPRGRLSLLA